MPAPVATTDLPSTCNVLNWVVFWPGFPKDELYTPRQCSLIPENFQLLAARTPRAKLGPEFPGSDPKSKLGHDSKQLIAERLKQSSGFPSVGDVTRVAEVPGYPGHIEIDVRKVPTRLVGGEISAGRYNSGSVELKSKVRDPRDVSQFLDGPVLTGVAFLGEEPPALNECHPDLQPRTRPVATFDDGSPVPANKEIPPEIVGAISDVMKGYAREFNGEYDAGRRTLRINGREFSDTTVCFSDFDPQPGPTMTPEQEAALAAAGFTPEQIAAMKAALPASAPAVPETNPTMSAGKKPFAADAPMAVEPDGDEAMMAACMKKYSEDPNATPEQKMFAAMHKKFSALEKSYSEDKKRIGELQASAEATKAKDEEAKAAEMSDRVEKAVAPLYRKVAPVVIEKVHKPALLALLASKQFSAETDRVKAFNDYLAPILALDDNKHLATGPGPAVTGGAGYTPGQLGRELAASGSRLDQLTGGKLSKRLAG